MNMTRIDDRVSNPNHVRWPKSKLRKRHYFEIHDLSSQRPLPPKLQILNPKPQTNPKDQCSKHQTINHQLSTTQPGPWHLVLRSSVAPLVSFTGARLRFSPSH